MRESSGALLPPPLCGGMTAPEPPPPPLQAAIAARLAIASALRKIVVFIVRVAPVYRGKNLGDPMPNCNCSCVALRPPTTGPHCCGETVKHLIAVTPSGPRFVGLPLLSTNCTKPYLAKRCETP